MKAYNTAHKKMKFSNKDFFSKCDQICRFLRIWPHLPKKSLMENFIFCAVYDIICILLISLRFLFLYFPNYDFIIRLVLLSQIFV